MQKTALLILFCTTLIFSCRFIEGQRIRGNGHVITEQRSVTGFSGVQNNGSLDVAVSQGDYKVTVEADENIVPYILTEMQGNKLVIRFRDNTWISHSSIAKVHVTAPQWNSLNINGSGNITGENELSGGGDLEIQVAGSGDAKLDLNKQSVSAVIYGSGNIILSGQAGSLSSQINGSGNLRAFDLKSGTVKTEIRGSGNAEVTATSSLEANIFGSGDVKFKGTPQINSHIRGSGSVSKAD
jgi:hypothetical protein